PIIGAAHVSNRHTRVKVAARSLEAQGLLCALAQDRQFEFAERPFHSEQQPVVDKLWVVHPILVDDQAVHQTAELEQGVPIAAIAGQTRSLDSENRAGGAGTDGGKQALKSRARRAASRTTKVIIDDNHVFPAKCTCACCKSILTTATFRVVGKLIGR